MSNYRRSNDSPVLAIIVVVVFAAFIVTSIVVGIASYTHTQTYAGCTVNDKDRTRGTDGRSDMRVYTDNCGVFSVKDSLADGTFSASDTYNKIKVGQTYTFNTRGKRIPVFSKFPNIIEVK